MATIFSLFSYFSYFHHSFLLFLRDLHFLLYYFFKKENVQKKLIRGPNTIEPIPPSSNFNSFGGHLEFLFVSIAVIVVLHSVWSGLRLYSTDIFFCYY